MKYNTTLPVSIIIPTYNRLRYLKETLQSVLDQTYENIEIIICDNASSDGTSEFFRNYKNPRVIYKRHDSPVSPLQNWNSWTEISNGELITFLPDDDKLDPKFVEKCLREFLNNENICLVKTGCFIIDEKSEIKSSYLPFKDSPSSGCQFVLDRLNSRNSELSLGAGYMFRKADFIQAGGFMPTGFPETHYADDYLWFSIALSGGIIGYINEGLWFYRNHSSNMAQVKSLDGFRNGFHTYIPMLLNLTGEKFTPYTAITTYLKSEYANKQVKARILDELSGNRRRKFSKSFSFLLKNRKIIIEYFGIRKLLYEFVLCLLLSRWLS